MKVEFKWNCVSKRKNPAKSIWKKLKKIRKVFKKELGKLKIDINFQNKRKLKLIKIWRKKAETF